MAGGSGLECSGPFRRAIRQTSVIFLTAVWNVELAVESMRQGAFDFLTKPYAPDVMLATIRRACERTALLRENAILRTTVRKLEGADEIIGESDGIRAVREMILRVAGANSTVPDNG